jgi:hypothetical protein
MAKQRMINTKLWRDSYVSRLDPSEKLVFLYSLTNPETNLCGIYELPIRQICLDTGFDKEMIIKIFERFERDERICYFDEWIIIKNALRHQNVENSKIRAGVEKELSSLPDKLMSHTWVMHVSSVFNIIKYNITESNIIKCNDENEQGLKIDFDCQYFKVSSGKIKEFSKTFHPADVLLELHRMKAWLDANPMKRKSDYPRFINNWLNRSLDALKQSHPIKKQTPEMPKIY